MFQPKVTIEVSATPSMSGDELVTVFREDVIKEEMIKRRVVINPDFKNEIIKETVETLIIKSKSDESTDEFVMRKSVEKREELAKAFELLSVNINPLLLIQLPDKQQGGADFKEKIIDILEKNHQIKIKNGKLAIYLSEDKTNLENITRNDSEVEVMIFKQAIALGWDCPRASILALFRDWKSLQFSVQTVGRILRMPELKYYGKEELNIGYVYTSLEDLSIIEDTAGDYLSIQYASRMKDYQPIQLRSVHPKRFREETRLSPEFIRDFVNAASSTGLKTKVNMDISDINLVLLSDGEIIDLDKHPDHIAEKGIHVERKLNTAEIQRLFDDFARESLKPHFFPEMRSIGRVKEAIYHYFKLSFPADFRGANSRAQIITLKSENRQLFIDAINLAKDFYIMNTGKRKKVLLPNESWEIPTFRIHNNRYEVANFEKSILQPYMENRNVKKPEKDFAVFLNNTLNGVKWFYKNGEFDATSFAIPYTDKNGDLKPFYVDWVVCFEDGKIGLFDTKEGYTAELAKYKAEGLAAYLKTENMGGKKLFGGIIVPKDGSWRFNDSDIYNYSSDLSGWKFLK